MKNKKIVIIPNFAESHFIKLQIQNLIDTIDPNIIVYNEGLFPKGPENKLNLTEEFKQKYCYKNTNLGFDTLETQSVIKKYQDKYPDKIIIHNEMKYSEDMGAPEAYTLAVSNFDELGIEVNQGDYIFPLEPDVFHHEDDKEEIQGYLNQIQPNQGFTSLWYDFLETQYYIERHHHPEFGGNLRGRKVCVRFGDMEFYKSIVSQFMTQDYSMLFPTELKTYHYNWFRPEKYKQLRFDQIVRTEPNYWDDFEVGLKEIRRNEGKQLIVLRPSRRGIVGDIGLTEHAARVNLKQPKHIKEHPNFLDSKGYDVVVLTTAITRPEVHNKSIPNVVKLLKEYGLKVKWIFNIDKVPDTDASLEDTKKNLEKICEGIDLEFIMNEKGCFYNAVKNLTFKAEKYLDDLRCGVLYLEDDWELTSPERFRQVLCSAESDLHIAMSNPNYVSFRPSLWGKDVFREIFVNTFKNYVTDTPNKLDPELIVCDTDDARAINKKFIMMWEGDFGVSWIVNKVKTKWNKCNGNEEGEYSFENDDLTRDERRRVEGEYHGNIKLNYDW